MNKMAKKEQEAVQKRQPLRKKLLQKKFPMIVNTKDKDSEKQPK